MSEKPPYLPKGTTYFSGATIYWIDGWTIIKPRGHGGWGFKMRRIGPLVLWRCWPHENAYLGDHFLARGWTFTEVDAVKSAGRIIDRRVQAMHERVIAGLSE